MCRVAQQSPNVSPSASACLIKINQKLLVLELADSTGWQIPFSNNQELSAQCGVHKTVWETTGLNVEVQDLLFVDNNVHYFNCAVSSPLSEEQTSLPVPSWTKHNIKRIELINVYETTREQWHTNFDLIKLRQGFTQSQAPLQ